MAEVNLFDYQQAAVQALRCGSILCGGVGSGKSITSIAYYYVHCGGTIVQGVLTPMISPKKLVIITTARKRDTFEWITELNRFGMNLAEYDVSIDSWNNIKKYENIQDAFFIFDEQRVVGKGAWVKAFLKICKVENGNHWILLSATPGDTWSDYIPVFIANGFYKNRTEFNAKHIVFSGYTTYPKIDRYVGEGLLIKYRNQILVNMDLLRPTVQHHVDIYTEYDKAMYKTVMHMRWDPYKEEPIENASGLCQCLRKLVNTDRSRIDRYLEVAKKCKRAIVFYNFNYELDILKSLDYGDDVVVAEWNGHKHELVPKSLKWIYLVQYNSGAEGWNCIETDSMIFFSQNYSYKMMVQAAGRIDRVNTIFKNLYYYHFKTRAPIDQGISKCLELKQEFNENKWFKKLKF